MVAARSAAAACCLLLGDPSGLLAGGLGGGADSGLPRLLVTPGLLLGGETLLPRGLERDSGLLEAGELLGQRVLLGGECGGALAGGEGALGRFRGGGRRLLGGLGSALLGLSGRAVEGGSVETGRLGVGERLGALAADGLDAGGAVDDVLRAGPEKGVELGDAPPCWYASAASSDSRRFASSALAAAWSAALRCCAAARVARSSDASALCRAMSASAAAARPR